VRVQIRWRGFPVATVGKEGSSTPPSVNLNLRAGTQGPVPVQAPPLQPLKREPSADAAVRVTVVPVWKACAQVPPQLMPFGQELTVPSPSPEVVTVSVCWRMKVTSTSTGVGPVVTEQTSPTQTTPAPDQPPSRELPSGLAVSITSVPLLKPAVQVSPQPIPAGEELTLPPPLPPRVTARVEVAMAKVAPMPVASSAVKVQVSSAPEHGPLQPSKL
jgi:hypothetical protein